MSNINISRRFDSLLSAIQTLESEGKLDLSYNRPLALQDAKFLERDCIVSQVFADDAGQLWYVVNTNAGRLLHKYEAFVSAISEGPVGLYFEQGDALVDLNLRIPNTLKARRDVAAANPSLLFR